jgi:hypothetical protein
VVAQWDLLIQHPNSPSLQRATYSDSTPLDTERNWREDAVLYKSGVEFMKTQTSSVWFPTLTLAAALVLAAHTVPAQEVTAMATATAGQPAPLLSYGVDQIIQLSRAKVSDDTIVNFIRNSGSSYGLDANQIVYLKQQGVSDTVVNVMLSQPKPAPSYAAQPAAATASSTATATVNINTRPETVTYQVPPIYVPSSSVYVIPDTQTQRYYAFSYNPYFGGRSYLDYQPAYYGSYNYYGHRPYYGYRPYYNNRVIIFGQRGAYGGGGHARGGWHR